MGYLQYDGDETVLKIVTLRVLNLIINGLPSILYKATKSRNGCWKVLNLIINGLPSILFLLFPLTPMLLNAF